jgi:hypothetical protein
LLEILQGDVEVGKHVMTERFDLAHVGALAGIPVRVDCVWSDPFLSASESLAQVLPSDDVHFEPGGHDPQFWADRAPAQLRFLADDVPVS